MSFRQALSSTQQAAVNELLSRIEEITNVDFAEVNQSPSSVGDVTFGLMDRSAANPGWTSDYPGPAKGGDVWLNSTPFGISASEVFNTVALHEIGHAVGLKHPYPYDPFGDAGPYLSGDEATVKYSMLSYAAHPKGVQNPVEPMLYDIAMLQYLYGANYAFNSGNTTYSDWDYLELRSIWDGGASTRSPPPERRPPH